MLLQDALEVDRPGGFLGGNFRVATIRESSFNYPSNAQETSNIAQHNANRIRGITLSLKDVSKRVLDFCNFVDIITS